MAQQCQVMRDGGLRQIGVCNDVAYIQLACLQK